MAALRRISVLAAALFAVTIVPANAPAAKPTARAAGDCAENAEWGALRTDFANRVVELVNAHRARIGLQRLHPSPSLTRSAEWKARHMARYGYMAHDDPGPPVKRSTGERIAACGFSGGGWGENIAYGYPTPDAVMGGWLNSPGHRANIENAQFTMIGVGAASRGGPLYWAQNFGAGPVVAHPTPEPTRSVGAARRPLPRGALAAGQVRTRMHAQAGRRFTTRVSVADRRSGGRVTGGSVKCDAVVAGRHLRVVVNAFKNGFAVCSWNLPRWAKGKRMTGLVRVRVDNRFGYRGFGRKVA